MRTTRNLVRKNYENRIIEDRVRPVHNCDARSANNIDVVSESVAEDPYLSIRRRPQLLLWLPLLHFATGFVHT